MANKYLGFAVTGLALALGISFAVAAGPNNNLAPGAGPLAPGKPAGVKQAQSIWLNNNENTILVVSGLAVVGGVVWVLTANHSRTQAPATTTTTTTTAQ